jgi:hypothetical protein
MQDNLTPNKTIPLADRDFEEVEGGYYDNNGWYYTPNGSFWDENGTYFNREGLDKHGGTFDEYGVYIPGPGWNEELGCYENELNGVVDKEALQKAMLENISLKLAEEYEYNKQFFEENNN